MTIDVFAGEDTPDAAAQMRARQMRRIPIVDAEGHVAGIVTLEDLIHHFGRSLDSLADVIGHFPIQTFSTDLGLAPQRTAMTIAGVAP